MAKRKVVKLTKKQARDALWERGNLRWLLRPEQQEVYDSLRGATGVMYCLYCSRRYGKTFIATLMAIEDGLRNKEWELGIVAPTKVQVKRVYGPIMETILRTCPPKIRPKWKSEIGAYLFPSTGAMLFMSGTDNKHWEDLLGMNLHKCIFDEPGTMKDLMEIAKRVILPMTMTTKEERGSSCGMIFIGTPSATPAHDYFFIKEECRARGNFSMRTIWDNSGLTKETILEYIKEAGGMESTTAKREYFCEDVVDTELAVIPEFNLEKEKEIVRDFERPEYYELYGALDPGFRNYTAYVLGYYDFLEGVIKVEGELLLNKKPTPEIAQGIRELEDKLFPNNKVHVRYSDTEPQVICDLGRYHELYFTPTRKDGKEARINELRKLILDGRILIHPRCTDLILHVKTAIWNDSRTKFLETSDGGHFDLLDALIYLVRNIDVWTNPYPGKYDHITANDHFVRPEARQKDDALKRALGV
jgi:hypothetical protein